MKSKYKPSDALKKFFKARHHVKHGISCAGRHMWREEDGDGRLISRSRVEMYLKPFCLTVDEYIAAEKEADSDEYHEYWLAIHKQAYHIKDRIARESKPIDGDDYDYRFLFEVAK